MGGERLCAPPAACRARLKTKWQHPDSHEAAGLSDFQSDQIGFMRQRSMPLPPSLAAKSAAFAGTARYGRQKRADPGRTRDHADQGATLSAEEPGALSPPSTLGASCAIAPASACSPEGAGSAPSPAGATSAPAAGAAGSGRFEPMLFM